MPLIPALRWKQEDAELEVVHSHIGGMGGHFRRDSTSLTEIRVMRRGAY